jgi:hypothetical protein
MKVVQTKWRPRPWRLPSKRRPQWSDRNFITKKSKWTDIWIDIYQQRKRSQGNGVSRKKLATARRRKILCAVPEVRNGSVRKGLGNIRTVRRAPRGRPVEEQWRGPERNRGIKDRSARWQFQPTLESTSDWIVRKTLALETAK